MAGTDPDDFPEVCEHDECEYEPRTRQGYRMHLTKVHGGVGDDDAEADDLDAFVSLHGDLADVRAGVVSVHITLEPGTEADTAQALAFAMGVSIEDLFALWATQSLAAWAESPQLAGLLAARAALTD